MWSDLTLDPSFKVKRGQKIAYNFRNLQPLCLLLDGLCVTNPPIRLMCPMSVCPSIFSFADSNLKMLCPIEFKLDREIDHHHS